MKGRGKGGDGGGGDAARLDRAGGVGGRAGVEARDTWSVIGCREA